MKNLLVFGVAFILSIFLNAQEIKVVEPSLDDYITLLNQSGYKAYCFNISDLKDSTYNISVELKEYSSDTDSVVSSKTLAVMKNRIMLQDMMWRELDDEELREIKEEAVDFENGVYRRADKITIGFLPTVNDSTERCLVEVENLGSVIFNMSLKEVSDKSGNSSFLYDSRPFLISTILSGEFQPLALYGSYWFDEKYNVTRFCGESQIKPDMSSEILESIPHYYVIGVTITPKN